MWPRVVFDFVVADIGSSCSSEWAPVLRLARQMILVTETNVPSLWSLERQITLLRALGIDSARLRLVVNRWHKADEEALQAFEKRVKLPIFERLPNDFKQVSRAVNMGAELGSGSKRSAGAEVSQPGGSDYRDPPRGGHRKEAGLSWGCFRENNR